MDSRKLHGWSLDKAELMGKPHLGGAYIGKGVNRYERKRRRCVVCGNTATNCHHLVPTGYGREFNLINGSKAHKLRSPLVVLCGSGTTGCHGRFHNGELSIRWSWESDSAETLWWTGELPNHCYENSTALFDYGHWVVKDHVSGREWVIGR